MRIGFVSDIHGEVSRLEEALRWLRREGTDQLWCLGDVVEDWNHTVSITRRIVELVTANCTGWLLGNHDLFAKARYIYSDPVIVEYLDKARHRVAENGRVLAHIMPSSPSSFRGHGDDSYIMEPEAALPEFGRYAFDVAFIGHTHVPAVFASDGRAEYFPQGRTFALDPKVRWIVSVGAVGPSRDPNEAPSCAIYETERRDVTILRA